MGIKTNKIQEMRVAIIALLIAYVASQAPVPQKKWLCCKEANNMVAPRWDTKCPTTSRRLQAVVESHCPKQLKAGTRILQAVQHPVAQTALTSPHQEEDYKQLLPTNAQLTLKDGNVSLTTPIRHVPK